MALGGVLVARGCGMPSLWRPAGRRRAALLWWSMVNVAVPLFVYAMLDAEGQVEASNWATPANLVMAVLALVAWRLWRRSRRHIAPSATEVLRADARPPVLYLRSFDADSTPVADDGGSRLYRAMLDVLQPLGPEEELARILQAAGPLVAIGRPGGNLPLLGAARLYVDDAHWQAEVLALMRSAQLVVIRIGASAGVGWEIEQALQQLPRQSVVLAFFGADALQPAPPVAQLLATVLGAHRADALPQAPPGGLLGRLWNDPRRRIGSLVCFPGGGAPCVMPMTQWPLFSRDTWVMFAMRLSAPPLRRAWRAVFQRLDIDAGGFAAPRSRLAAVLLAVLLGGFGAHWFYLGRRRRGWLYAALFVLGSFIAGPVDALRFIWMDRAHFDALGTAAPR